MSVATQVNFMFGRRSFCRSVRGVTLVEVLVVIAVIAVLMAILFPVIGHVRMQARMTANLSNLRQAAVAMTTYTAVNRGMFIFPIDPSAYEVGEATGGTSEVRLPVPTGQEGSAPVLVSYFWVADYWPEVLEYAGVVGLDGAKSQAFSDIDLVTGKPSTRFLFSCSLLANHEYWNQSMRMSGTAQLRPPTIDSVQAPASKIMASGPSRCGTLRSRRLSRWLMDQQQQSDHRR
jgi:prepilin-type N-terminal cleavage/methylation domain-containing protein